MTAAFRFFEKVWISESGCWLWQANRNQKGYGMFYPVTIGPNRRGVSAHRYSWELLVGPIPDGHQLDHLCRVPSCVNPDHLEPVTPLENSRRGLKGDMYAVCRRGHDMLVGSNVRVSPGKRECRQCLREWNREYRARRKAHARTAT